MSTHHIALCCDANYLMPAAVTIQSILGSSHHPGALHVWLLSPGIPTEKSAPLERMVRAAGAQLTFVDCDSAHTRLQSVRVDRHISAASYYRLFAPELLPASVERLVYVDCDLLFRADIGRLADIDLGDCVLAAVHNPLVRHYRTLGLAQPTDYFNAGVLVLDLTRLRRTGEHRRAVEFALQHPEKIPSHDQDALNHVVAGQWRRLDLRWNQQFKFFRYGHLALGFTHQELERVREAPFVVHFTSKSKPWHFDNCHPFRDEWFEVLDRTPCAGWRPAAGGVRARARRAILRVLPFSLHPDHLRNEYRSRYHALRSRWSRRRD